MTLTSRAALCAVLLALPGVAVAQSGSAFGIQVARGALAAGPWVSSETEIDPSGFSAPVTIIRGWVHVPPAPGPAAAPAQCDCDGADTRMVLVLDDGWPLRRGPVWSLPGRPLHNPWYSWMRSYRLSLLDALVRSSVRY